MANSVIGGGVKESLSPPPLIPQTIPSWWLAMDLVPPLIVVRQDVELFPCPTHSMCFWAETPNLCSITCHTYLYLWPSEWCCPSGSGMFQYLRVRKGHIVACLQSMFRLSGFMKTHIQIHQQIHWRLQCHEITNILGPIHLWQTVITQYVWFSLKPNSSDFGCRFARINQTSHFFSLQVNYLPISYLNKVTVKFKRHHMTYAEKSSRDVQF